MTVRIGRYMGGVAAIVLATLACAPPKNSVASGAGTLTVDAEISKGTRFTVYCNDVWSAPQTKSVTAEQRTKYMFSLPNTLRSLRLDPSEAADSNTLIYAIVIAMPGQPAKALPLTDLPKFVKYHCDVGMLGKVVDVRATGTEEFLMSTVAPDIYPVATSE